MLTLFIRARIHLACLHTMSEHVYTGLLTQDREVIVGFWRDFLLGHAVKDVLHDLRLAAMVDKTIIWHLPGTRPPLIKRGRRVEAESIDVFVERCVRLLG